MNLTHLTDDELHESNMKAARTEREAAIVEIYHLVETKRRHLYSKYKCASLHAYCVKYMKMTNGDAYRKMNSANLVDEVPELELKLADGDLSPTHLADAAAFFIREKTSTEEKKEILSSIENTTTEKAQEILIGRSTQPEKHFREKQKRKTKELTEVTLYLDNETMEALQRLKEIWSHAIPKGELSQVIKRAAKEAVEKHEPLKKKSPAPGTIAKIKDEVLKRDEGCCTYVDPGTGERCGSQHFLEFDHIVPKAMGGEDTVENFRLLCRTHNQRHAISTYGLTKMRSYMREPAKDYQPTG